jgi:hypothetical protein
MFLRTPPSDAFQATGLVALVAHLWNYTSFALARDPIRELQAALCRNAASRAAMSLQVASLDSYGAAGASMLRAAAAAANVTVSTEVSFSNDAAGFDAQHALLADACTRGAAFFCQAADAGPFLMGALAAGVGGAGYLWLGSDAVTNSATWESGGVLADPVQRLAVLKGFFGMAPSVDQSGAAYQAPFYDVSWPHRTFTRTRSTPLLLFPRRTSRGCERCRQRRAAARRATRRSTTTAART